MAFNQTANTQIDDNVKTDLILKEGADIIPKSVIPTIQPTYEVNKRINNIVRNADRTSSGGATIFTTPTDRDFFLTGFVFGLIKDATCDVATGSVTFKVIIDGTTVSLGTIPVITLTAQERVYSMSFAQPLKIDRGSAITHSTTNTFTVGVMVRSCTLVGYLNSPSQPQQRLQT